MGDKRSPRVWWVLPANDQMHTAICIDAPPEIWQNKVTGDRIEKQYWNLFVKVAEVIAPHPWDISHD
jgi:hypothetical protein